MIEGYFAAPPQSGRYEENPLNIDKPRRKENQT
jgi:hypothetical protein